MKTVKKTVKKRAIKYAIAGLYAVTPDISDTPTLLHIVRLALQGGARVLQYRNKAADAALRLQQAQALRRLSREFDIVFIVNDDPLLAVQVDADGVHLGADDGGVAAARALLGHEKIIGVSCYNRISLALAAAQQGADYVAFGAFFTSGIKPEAVQANTDLLREARGGLGIPIVAIGGITAQNGGTLIGAGADALAVISAVFAVPDIESAARKFSNLFEQGKQI